MVKVSAPAVRRQR